MGPSQIRAVVIPVYENSESDYLSAIARRGRDFTALIYGWQSAAGAEMTGPARLLESAKQHYVPFLFTPAEQDAPKSVTHVAISGLILHRRDRRYQDLRPWLHEHRVERFAQRRERNPGTDVGTFYVVTGGEQLSRALPFSSLALVNHTRTLDPNKKRGYAWVWLPPRLQRWYLDACKAWDRAAPRLPIRFSAPGV